MSHLKKIYAACMGLKPLENHKILTGFVKKLRRRPESVTFLRLTRTRNKGRSTPDRVF